MPLPRQEVDATTPKYLRDKYAIVGVGETTYTRGSGKTTRALGTWAVRNAILDAGLKASRHRRHARLFGRQLDGATFIAGDLGIRLNFYMDVVGGGSSTEALVGIAIGIMEAGMCKMRRDLPLDERLFARCASAAPARARPRRSTATRCTAAPMAGRAPGRASRPPSCATCTITAPSPSRWRW